MEDKEYFRAEWDRRYPGAWAAVETRHSGIEPEVVFARTPANPMDRRLGFCAWFLATIQVLEERGAGFAEIREFCLAVTHEYVRPKSAWRRWVKGLPGILLRLPVAGLFRGVMRRKVGKLGHADGFLVQIVEAPGVAFGFDIVECGIVKLFRRHGAGEYVTILCEVDELTSAMAGLEMHRSGTIARGAARCDFRFGIRRGQGIQSGM